LILIKLGLAFDPFRARLVGSLRFAVITPDWKMTDRPPTPPGTLRMARQIVQNIGLRYVYTGNNMIPGAIDFVSPLRGAADWP
jgi:hypothetical protein